jgi:hypothetical protein
LAKRHKRAHLTPRQYRAGSGPRRLITMGTSRLTA